MAGTRHMWGVMMGSELTSVVVEESEESLKQEITMSLFEFSKFAV